MAAEPTRTVDLHVGIEYGQLHVDGGSDASAGGRSDPAEAERGVDDAHSSGRQIGKAGNFLVVLAPVSMNESALVRFEVWPSEPGVELDSYDQIEEIDLDIPLGRLSFSECLATEEDIQDQDVPPGRYRLRMSGWNYDEAVTGNNIIGGPDSYRFQIWPRDADNRPVQRKSWQQPTVT